MCRRVVKTPEQSVSGNGSESYHIKLAYRAVTPNEKQHEYENTPASTFGGTIIGGSNPATPEEPANDAEMQRVKFVNDCNGVNIVQNTQFDSISSRSGRLGQPHSDEGNVFLDTPVNRPEVTLAPRGDRAGMQITADNAQAVLSPEACVFVASLAATRTDEQLGQSVHAVFSQFGPVWIKIRRDQKGMPFAFAQYEHVADALRAVEEGRGTVIDGRACRTERAKVNRGVYLSNVRGGRVSESEARRLLEVYGAIEKVWYATPTELEIYHLPMGIWVKFAFYEDCRDAEHGLRDNVNYRLDQPGKKAVASRSPLRAHLQHENTPRHRRNDGPPNYIGGRKEATGVQGYRIGLEEGRETYIHRALAIGISPSHIAAIFNPTSIGHVPSVPYSYNPWYPQYCGPQYNIYAPGGPAVNHDAMGNNVSYGPAPYFPCNTTYGAMSGYPYPPIETNLAELP